MDPASIVGLLGSTASLIVLSGKVALDIHNILSKYSNVPNKLDDLKNDCLILEIGFKKVNTWLEQNPSSSNEGDNGLRTCLDVFNKALVALDSDISKALSKNSATGFQLSAKKKMKYLWNEQTMNEHAERVRHTRSNLHFLLAAFQLPENDSNRQIRQVARAATIRYIRDSDGESIRSRRTVDFNHVLANSTIYRQLGIDNESARGGPSLSTSFSAGTTLLATQDYHNSAEGHLEFREGDLVKIVQTNAGSFWLGEFEGKTGLFSIECCDINVGLEDRVMDVGSRKGNLPMSSIVPNIRQAPKPPSLRATNSLENADVSQFIAQPQEKRLNAVIQTGNVHQLRRILEDDTGIDIQAKDEKGWTPLHYLAHAGKREMAMELIRRGADVNAENKDNVTPLALVVNNASKEDIDMVRLLLESGASVWMAPSSDSTFLHQQVSCDRWETASLLIKHGLQIDTKDSLHKTPLLLATHLRRKEFVEKLAQSGASLNAADDRGMTALHEAAGKDFPEIVKILKDSGANLDARNTEGQSALHHAASAGSIKVVQILLTDIGITGLEIKDRIGATPLHYAASSGQWQLLRALASDFQSSPMQKKLWNQRTHDGRMPLHMAASKDQVAAGATLIQDGADIRAYTFLPFSPLQCAAQHGHVKFAAMLIQQGGKALIHEKYQSPLDTFLVKIEPIAGIMLMIVSFYVPVLASMATLVSAVKDLAIMSFLKSVLLLFLTVGLDVVLVKENMAWGSARTQRRKMIWRIKTKADLGELGAHVFFFSIPWNIALAAAMRGLGFHAIAAYHFYTTLGCLIGILIGSLEYLGSLVGLWMVTNDALPLHLAIQHEHEAVVRLLIENGADLEARDNDYDTAVELAVRLPSNKLGWLSTDGIPRILKDAGAEIYIYSYR